MARLLTTVRGRFNSTGAAGIGVIEEPIPPGVYAADANAVAGLSQYSANIAGLLTNPVSFTLSAWFQIPGVSTQNFLRLSEEGQTISFGCSVSCISGALSINLKDSGLTTRFTYALAGIFTVGWNHLALSVKIDEATEAAGTRIWCNDTEFTGLGASTWSMGSNMAFRLTDYLFSIFNEKTTNNGVAVYDGCLGPYWFDINRFADFSDLATRRKFIDADGRPVGLGANGETPFGVRPLLYFDGPFDEIGLNRGTGGDFMQVDRGTDAYGVNTWTECGDNPATGALAF